MAMTPKELSFRATGAIALVLCAAFGLRALSLTYSLEREIWLLRATGYSALGALFLSLSMTPFSRLAAWARSAKRAGSGWVAWRRSFGIAAAGFGLVHGALVFTTYLRGSWPAVLNTPYLRAGLMTLSILTALILTSFPRLTRWLGVRHWQHLHRLSYVAALFLLQHLLLAPFAPRSWVVGLFGGLAVISLLRLLKRPSA